MSATKDKCMYALHRNPVDEIRVDSFPPRRWAKFEVLGTLPADLLSAWELGYVSGP